jgi:pSer/pThr/pTyr-binding forkhead associated (FHA) protein
VVSQVCDAVNALSGSQELSISAPESPLPKPPVRIKARPLALHCLAGEFANETVVIPEEGISIGRDPARVNLVLAATEISGVHARVIPETKSAQLWLEDMRSLNGTFRWQAGGGPQGGHSGWVQLHGKTLLSPGARFRLAVDGPEFEIREL